MSLLKAFFMLVFVLAATVTFAKTQLQEDNSQIAPFFKTVANFENTIANKKISPADLNAKTKKFQADYEAIKPILERSSATLKRRSLAALERANKKLHTPHAFSNITQGDIYTALAGIPQKMTLPLPRREGYMPLDKQFYCLKSLLEFGGRKHMKVDSDEFFYVDDPKSVYVKSFYNEEPSTFVYTKDGLTYITDKEAVAGKCLIKFGDKYLLSLSMKTGEDILNRTLVLTSTRTINEVQKPASNGSTAGYCARSTSVPTNRFSHIHDFVGQMALDLAREYEKSIQDLPRQLVLRQNGETSIERENEDNLLRVMKQCESNEVGGGKMRSAILQLENTRLPGDATPAETVAP